MSGEAFLLVLATLPFLGRRRGGFGARTGKAADRHDHRSYQQTPGRPHRRSRARLGVGYFCCQCHQGKQIAPTLATYLCGLGGPARLGGAFGKTTEWEPPPGVATMDIKGAYDKMQDFKQFGLGSTRPPGFTKHNKEKHDEEEQARWQHGTFRRHGHV